MQSQWIDLFNQKPQSIKSTQSDYDIICNHFKSLNSAFYVKESIPQSIIKKSKRDAHKKTKQ